MRILRDLSRDQAPRGGVPAARRGVPDQAGHDGSAWQVSLIWNEGVLGAFERALPWKVVKLDAIVRGFLGTNALSRFSRAPAPVMQYAPFSMRDMGNQDTLNTNRCAPLSHRPSMQRV